MFGLAREPLTQQYTEEFIQEYQFVRKAQLLKLYENAGLSTKKARKDLSTIRSFSGKVYYDGNSDSYYSSNYVSSASERAVALDKCMWVLIDFLGKVEHHFPIASVFSPSQICLMHEERAYEIAYCPAGLERYFNNQLRAARAELLYRAESSYFAPIVEQDDKAIIQATRYIVLVEDIEKAHEVESGLISFFVTLDKDNKCNFYPLGAEQTA
jgi:hypothetical protein